MTPEHIASLRATFSAIKNGELQIADVFTKDRPVGVEDALKDTLKDTPKTESPKDDLKKEAEFLETMSTTAPTGSFINEEAYRQHLVSMIAASTNPTTLKEWYSSKTERAHRAAPWVTKEMNDAWREIVNKRIVELSQPT
jgi:hypothetical protein